MNFQYRPKNNQTVIVKSEQCNKIIVPKTHDSQIPKCNEKENGEANDSFLFHIHSAINIPEIKRDVEDFTRKL